MLMNDQSGGRRQRNVIIDPDNVETHWTRDHSELSLNSWFPAPPSSTSSPDNKMDSQEFKVRGRQMVDYIIQYLEARLVYYL